MKNPKITLKLVRHFAIGFNIHSPKLNGLSFEINLACFSLAVWGKGSEIFGVRNYWNGDGRVSGDAKFFGRSNDEKRIEKMNTEAQEAKA